MGNLYLGNNRVKPSTCVGINPSGTINITTNGNIDVTNYANANVNVQGISPVTIYKGTVDGNGVLTSFNNENDTTTVAYKTPTGNIIFENFTDITSGIHYPGTEPGTLSLSTIINFNIIDIINTINIDLNNIIYLNNQCSLKDFSSLGFYQSNLKSVNLCNLQAIYANYACYMAFNGCSKLTSISLNNLEDVYGDHTCEYMFSFTKLQDITFTKLEKIDGDSCFAYMFQGCSKLKNIFFPSLNTRSFGTTYTNQFDHLIDFVKNCTIHFPSNMENTISTLSGYPRFGGDTATTLLYDLPETN